MFEHVSDGCVFFGTRNCFIFLLQREMFLLDLMRKNDKSPYSFRRKNGDLHFLVRFGLRTKAAIFFICTHLSRVKRKAIVKNNFHCTLGEPPYHETPRRTYSQYSVIIYSIHRGTDSKLVEMERDNTFCCLLAENIHSLVGVAGSIV